MVFAPKSTDNFYKLNKNSTKYPPAFQSDQSPSYDPQDAPNQEGIYLIDSGQCSIMHPTDQFNAKTLRRWDFFGEIDMLKVVGYQYFGDIVVATDEVTCFYISAENFKKIPVYEQMQMKMYC